jgi:hypothetical protein
MKIMISRRLRLITRKQIYRRWWPTHEDLESFLVGCLTCTAFGPVLDFMGELPCRDIKLCTDGYMQAFKALSSCEFKFQSSLIFVNLYRRSKGHFDPQIYRHPCPLPRASKQGRSFQQPTIFKSRSSFSSLSSNQCYTVITLHLTKPTGRSQDDSRAQGGILRFSALAGCHLHQIADFVSAAPAWYPYSSWILA